MEEILQGRFNMYVVYLGKKVGFACLELALEILNCLEPEVRE